MSLAPLRPVQRIAAGERLDGQQYEIDGESAWRITAHSKDGRSASFWAMRRTVSWSKRAWVVCAGIESESYYSRHATFEDAAAAAGLRARKYLNAGRRMARLKAARAAGTQVQERQP